MGQNLQKLDKNSEFQKYGLKTLDGNENLIDLYKDIHNGDLYFLGDNKDNPIELKNFKGINFQNDLGKDIKPLAIEFIDYPTSELYNNPLVEDNNLLIGYNVKNKKIYSYIFSQEGILLTKLGIPKNPEKVFKTNILRSSSNIL